MQEYKLEERQSESHSAKNVLSEHACRCVTKHNYLIMVRV